MGRNHIRMKKPSSSLGYCDYRDGKRRAWAVEHVIIKLDLSNEAGLEDGNKAHDPIG